jgi:catalase
MANKPGFDTDTGRGGETHQRVPKRGSHGVEGHLTTNQGIRVSDNQNSLKAGMRGPTLLEDFVLREKIFHFDHERIPERIVHARGSAAHGYFELYKSLANVTKADLFQRAGEKTPVFARFSTVAGGAGSVDTPAMCAASRSSSIPSKATGIWSATTSRYSSSRMRLSFRT